MKVILLAQVYKLQYSKKKKERLQAPSATSAPRTEPGIYQYSAQSGFQSLDLGYFGNKS